MQQSLYTTSLQAGLGMVKESCAILDLWEKGMTSSDLYAVILDAGIFPNVSARRLRNLIIECFSPRFLCDKARPAEVIKCLKNDLNMQELLQLMFVYVCHANLIVKDFVIQTYWPAYIAGRNEITNEDAKSFVIRANQNGLTTKMWSETTIRRVSGYLTGICADFGLLENVSRSTRRIVSCRLSQKTVLVLAYELHFSGMGDNSIIGHNDWKLFGMERPDVLDEFKRLAMKSHLLIQSAGDVVRIGWKYKSIQELENAIRN